MEVERGLSRNTTLEFERLIKVAQAERDKAREHQREADEESYRCGNAMKKFEEERDREKERANALAIDLAKA